MRALLRHIFGIASSEEAAHRSEAHSQARDSISRQGNQHGGQGIFLPGQETARTPHAAQRGVDVAAAISAAIDRDVIASEKNVFHTHQRIGELDVYFLYNVESSRRDLTFTLRVHGEPEIWDCSSGEVLPHHRFSCTDDKTTVRLTMEANQGIVLVMRPPGGRPAVTDDKLGTITHVEATGDSVQVQGTVEDGGLKSVRVRHAGREYGARARFAPAPAPLHLTGDWSFRLTPTMDNRWGDFREPASDERIGAEARQCRYREEKTPGTASGTAQGWHSRDYGRRQLARFHLYFRPLLAGQRPIQARADPAGAGGSDRRRRRCSGRR